MTESDTTVLQEELEHFQQEKERVRNIVGAIGGKASGKRDGIINVVFIIVIAVLFILDILRHLLGFHVPLPAMFSLELAVLLVSIKIIWMIHKQSKVEHFQFWILSSIEFRLNDLAKQMRKLESQLEHHLPAKDCAHKD